MGTVPVGASEVVVVVTTSVIGVGRFILSITRVLDGGDIVTSR